MEPLEDGLAERIEGGKVNLNWDKKKVFFIIYINCVRCTFIG